MEHIKFHEQTNLINQIADLLKQLQNGNEQAFSDLYDISASYISMMICNSKVQEADRDDLMQEIYYSIYIGVPKLKQCQAGLAWIKRIANNKIVDYCRKKYREEQHQTLYSEVEEYIDEKIENDLFEMPENIVVNKEIQNIVREILMSLPQKQYHILFSFYFNNMKISEIAETMQMNENTVKTNLRRAKKNVEEQIMLLQKRTGIVLQTIPFGIAVFAIFSKEESVYATVLIGRELIPNTISNAKKTNVIQCASKTASPKSSFGKSYGMAQKKMKIIGSAGTTKKIALAVAVLVTSISGGVVGVHRIQQYYPKTNEISIEERTTEMRNGAEEAFHQFLSEEVNIQGETISVNIVSETDNETGSTWEDYYSEKLPEGMIGHKMDDFDQDGELELLIIYAKNGNRLDKSTDDESDMIACMYEYVEGKVLLSDSVECGVVDTRANELMANWLIWGEKKYILQESYIALSAVSDGFYREFTLLKYEKAKFKQIYVGKCMGSSIEDNGYEEQVKRTCQMLNISSDYSLELEDCPYYSSYLKEKKFIAQIITKNTIGKDMLMECREKMMEGEMDSFHVAEGKVKQGDWEDFKKYNDEKYER